MCRGQGRQSHGFWGADRTQLVLTARDVLGGGACRGLLVRDSAGGVYGVTYKWRADESDADLLPTSVTEDIPIKTATGKVRHQTWYYPSRKDGAREASPRRRYNSSAHSQ